GFAAMHRERDVVDGPHPTDLPLQDDALGDREVHLQVLDAQQLAVGGAVLGNYDGTGARCHCSSVCLLNAMCNGLGVGFAATGDVDPASNAMARYDWFEARVFGHAALDRVWAARLERAAWRRVDQVGRQALDGH